MRKARRWGSAAELLREEDGDVYEDPGHAAGRAEEGDAVEDVQGQPAKGEEKRMRAEGLAIFSSFRSTCGSPEEADTFLLSCFADQIEDLHM